MDDNIRRRISAHDNYGWRVRSVLSVKGLSGLSADDIKNVIDYIDSTNRLLAEIRLRGEVTKH